MTKKDFKRIDTRLIHAGEPDPKILGAVSMPIFQSSTYVYSGATTYDDLRYIRLNNTPNHRALHEKLAAIECAEAALVTSSGMAAITTTLLTVLSAGDHLLAQDCLYGGTHDFLRSDFASFGLSYDFVDGNDPASWKSRLRRNTKAFYVEALSNPLLGMADLEAVVAFAREHGLITIIDNTFTSPVGFRPAEWGFDLSVHSCTKYLNGHTDIVAGAVIGKAPLIKQITHRLNHLGGSLDPHAAFLLHRGMKTLALRVRCQSENALKLALFLEQHPAVEKVNYPGLASHPQHERAKRLFDCSSGMLSFELRGGEAAAERMMSRLVLPIIAPSLGGVETLITRPVTTSHAGMSREDRLRIGITDALVRVSVGIESIEELVNDFRQAIES